VISQELQKNLIYVKTSKTHQLLEDMIVAHATPSTRMDAYKREGCSHFGLRPVNLYSILNLARTRSDEFSSSSNPKQQHHHHHPARIYSICWLDFIHVYINIYTCWHIVIHVMHMYMHYVAWVLLLWSRRPCWTLRCPCWALTLPWTFLGCFSNLSSIIYRFFNLEHLLGTSWTHSTFLLHFSIYITFIYFPLCIKEHFSERKNAIKILTCIKLW